MSKKMKVFFMNSGSSVLYQIVNSVLVLITRNIFIKYIGIELLGINSTIGSLINAFSLTELGFQSVIIYNLYKPLNNHDYVCINKIMTIYKVVYRTIAAFVFIIGLLCLPILHIFLKGAEIDTQVILIYILQLFNVTISYLLSYKRTLLYADNKDYYSKILDIFFKVTINVLKIFIVIFTKSILYYLILDILYTLISNLFIHMFCNKLFRYLKKTEFDKTLFFTMFKDVKDVFFGKISGYIYSSTDNLVVSSIIGPSYVALLTNYTSLVLQLKSLINSVLYPIVPIIGKQLTNDKDTYKLFNTYTKIRIFFAGTLLIPTFILIDDFITMWIGETYILSSFLTTLLLFDFYISITYAPCYEFNNSSGLFAFEKKVMLYGAILNIIMSVLLSLIIGLEGVLIGTVCCQIFLWITRSYICFKNVLKVNNNQYSRYWIENFVNIFIIAFLILIITFMKSLFLVHVSIFNFIFWGCVSVISYWCIFLFMYRKSYLIGYIKSILIKKE